jgi:hypothetical protein
MTKYLKTREGSLEDLAKQMQNKVIESDYQDKFKKELDKAGKPIGQMTGAEKKAFFNKIDKMHTAKNEQAKEPYAIGMACYESKRRSTTFKEIYYYKGTRYC